MFSELLAQQASCRQWAAAEPAGWRSRRAALTCAWPAAAGKADQVATTDPAVSDAACAAAAPSCVLFDVPCRCSAASSSGCLDCRRWSSASVCAPSCAPCVRSPGWVPTARPAAAVGRMRSHPTCTPGKAPWLQPSASVHQQPVETCQRTASSMLQVQVGGHHGVSEGALQHLPVSCIQWRTHSAVVGVQRHEAVASVIQDTSESFDHEQPQCISPCPCPAVSSCACRQQVTWQSLCTDLRWLPWCWLQGLEYLHHNNVIHGEVESCFVASSVVWFGCVARRATMFHACTKQQHAPSSGC